ncbi:hypothetical protein BKA70DRAFT_1374814 [Coprinopsis sp. MPI-PUGE-AT-0042]|nr:hypothetical protein BKA70DRAFT_1374814 [Coprinopsis sp. MPI-PUGE-AT-0042]
MGWFSSSKPAEEEGTTTRQNRKQCWDARDAIVKAGEEGAACAAENKAYAENCAHSWIEYFNQRRVIADAQKERLARGAAQAEEWKAKNGKS